MEFAKQHLAFIQESENPPNESQYTAAHQAQIQHVISTVKAAVQMRRKMDAHIARTKEYLDSHAASAAEASRIHQETLRMVEEINAALARTEPESEVNTEDAPAGSTESDAQKSGRQDGCKTQ